MQGHTAALAVTWGSVGLLYLCGQTTTTTTTTELPEKEAPSKPDGRGQATQTRFTDGEQLERRRTLKAPGETMPRQPRRQPTAARARGLQSRRMRTRVPIFVCRRHWLRMRPRSKRPLSTSRRADCIDWRYGGLPRLFAMSHGRGKHVPIRLPRRRGSREWPIGPADTSGCGGQTMTCRCGRTSKSPGHHRHKRGSHPQSRRGLGRDCCGRAAGSQMFGVS